eukprot:12581857-Alexandrium_andersonii.AAC.1
MGPAGVGRRASEPWSSPWLAADAVGDSSPPHLGRDAWGPWSGSTPGGPARRGWHASGGWPAWPAQ